MENKCQCAAALGQHMQRIDRYSCAIRGVRTPSLAPSEFARDKHGQIASI